VSAMRDPTHPDVRICGNARELSERAAEATVATIADAVARQGRCSLVFSGGNTPRALYALLASRYRDQIPWAQVHAFWGDERYVPPDDSSSNYRMARESLLEQVPLPFQNVHPMPTHFPSPEAAAHDYERALRADAAHHGSPFDLMFLGMGEDGHTASLFPGSPALHETTRWVVATTAPAEPSTRLTLTFPAIAMAARIFVLVSGTGKAEALAHVLSTGANPEHYPAAGLPLRSGLVTWWVDRDAASRLRERRGPLA
jgi:6-phosphogluconolactonase